MTWSRISKCRDPDAPGARHNITCAQDVEKVWRRSERSGGAGREAVRAPFPFQRLARKACSDVQVTPSPIIFDSYL